MSTHSAACCKIPPIVVKDYKGKGKYETIDGTKFYVTGPSDAKTAIFIVYDIFGFYPQTIQGADILATSDEHHQYQVYIPDFFEGSPLDISLYPPDNEEKQKKVGAWFSTRGPPMGVSKIPGYLKLFESYNKNIKTWGALGFCWGGKVISLTSQVDSPWKAAFQSSPAMIDPAEAAKTTIPMGMLASKDEEPKDVEAYGAKLTVPKQIARLDNVIHGFMTARGDLNNKTTLAEYEKGYQTVLEFMAQHL